jgi:hypothetical protein
MVTDCIPQRVRIRTIGVRLALFKEFAKDFGEDIKTRSSVSPLDKHSGDVSCSGNLPRAKSFE